MLQYRQRLARQVCPQVCNILPLTTRIDHEEKCLLRPTGNNQVIQYSTLFVSEYGIGLPIVCQPINIHRHKRLKHRGTTGALYNDLTHVGDIKQPGRLPSMQMLANDASRVLHRHVITSKGYHFGAQLSVQRIKRRVQ